MGKHHRTCNRGEEARKNWRTRIRPARALWKPAEYLPNLRRKVHLRSETIRSIAGEQVLASSVLVFSTKDAFRRAFLFVGRCGTVPQCARATAEAVGPNPALMQASASQK